MSPEYIGESLASRKGGNSNVTSEVSETAKAGTDEQNNGHDRQQPERINRVDGSARLN